jgi:hypothetical protein
MTADHNPDFFWYNPCILKFYLFRERQNILADRLQEIKVIHGTGIHSSKNNTTKLL